MTDTVKKPPEPKHVYRCGDATVRANTKGEALARLKKIVGGRLPAGTKLERLS